MIDVSSYALESLGQDAEFVLYRGQRETDPSHILVVAPVLKRPAQGTLRRLEHQYVLRTRLDPEWAILPLDLVSHNGRTMLVLDDPGGEPLNRLLEHPLDLASSLRIAAGLATALAGLHARGLIHKDVKPANILVDPISNRVWLTGFSIASELPRERPAPDPLETIAGTLAYMAPEQTGRMNRSIDSRSDLYSLGVTVYEILTGSLPFTASDPIEWVHCHIARQPIAPRERRKEIPPVLSAIILKLLAKTAEERYQTASGAESDLRRCLELLEGSSGSRRIRHSGSSGAHEAQRTFPPSIAEFSLGEHDTPHRLLIPERLYGRAREIKTLLASFDRVVSSGTPELVLVSGYSGIGKSSVVNELQKVLVPPRGLFASGKFDQFKRDIPYATLAQAFQSLIRPLLNKSETELRNWRHALQEALGLNGQLIVDLVPELTFILGEQSPVPDLPLQDAQRRFQLVFRRFIGVFARREHPLALFLDDLQWLDAATLDLLEDLLTSDFANQQNSEPTEAKLRRTLQPDVQHLMLIGAYRDNEVSSAHPLISKLEAIRAAGAVVQEMILAPLSCEDLGQLIADALHCELERAAPLAQVVHDKTAGNPLFAIQFISALNEEALLTFDHSNGRWSWDLNRIHEKGYTGNVVDLMVGKLNRLPPQTQKALQQLACLGNGAKTTTLSIVHETLEDELHSDLREAVRLEYVVRLGDSYKYAHDRVQEAAYSLIPEQLRAETHLGIGRLLAAHTAPEKREESIFEIVNQFNRGAALIVSPDEREQVAELNLIAGKRAKVSTAYASALSYFSAGSALLMEDRWMRRHDLAFALELCTTECEFLTGRHESAEERLSELAGRAATQVDRAAVTCLKLELYTVEDRSDRAVEVCIEYLRQEEGVQWAAHPTERDVRQEYDRLCRLIGNGSIEALVDLPVMDKRSELTTMDVLTRLWSAAFFTDENLAVLVATHMAIRSIEHGNTHASCCGYAWLAIMAGSFFGDYRSTRRFGQLSVDLVEQRGLAVFADRVYNIVAAGVVPWTQHIRAGPQYLRRALYFAAKTGDLAYSAYSYMHLASHLLACGEPLDKTEAAVSAGLSFAQKARFGLIVAQHTAHLQLVHTLRGFTREFGTFDDASFDEGEFEQHLVKNPSLNYAACWYWIRKIQARVWANDPAAAVQATAKARALLWTSRAVVEHAEYHFYGALARAASCDSVKDEHFEALVTHHRQLEVWAENCPENFEDRAALVTAEIARIEGRDLDAMRLYEQAVRSARANGFVHNEGLANELAARFYLERGFEKIAYTYFQDARYCYLRWGATAKVRQLDELYPHLREQEPVPGPTSTIEAAVEQLDLANIIRVSQALSSEIVLEKLIDTLMRTAIEQAGAQRGLLIFPRGVEQRVEAEATTSGDTIIVRLTESLGAEAEVPESIMQYVMRTRENVILDDASAQNPFSADPYIRRHHARSILCLPLINQVKVVGVLYLENNLTPGVFTPDRLAVLKLLASQAAISLENATLYSEIWDENSQRITAEEALRASEERWRRLFENSSAGIALVAPDSRYIRVNAALQKMLGYTEAELQTLTVSQITHEEDRVTTETILAETVEGKRRVYRIEKRYRRKDGSIIWVDVSAVFVPASGNESAFFSTVIVDITDRKRAEEEIKRIRRLEGEIRQVSRAEMMGGLTASLAHELNQPLAAVQTTAQAARRFLAAKSPELSKVKAAIDDVIQDNARAAEIIRNVRALFQRDKVQMSPIKIRQILYDVERIVRPDAAVKNVILQIELPTALPTVIGNRTQLIEALMNLVLNAFDSVSESDNGPREVKMRAVQPEPGCVRVSVRDSGKGIDPQIMPRLFDAFFTTKPNGMGMGLAIVRSIVENHGGYLRATPNPDRGATFEFDLPVKADQ